MGNMHTAWFRRVAARWTDSLYSVKLATGPMLEAKKLPAESQPLRQELRNDMSITLVYNFLGQIPLSQGDNHAPAGLFSEGLEAARRVPIGFPS